MEPGYIVAIVMLIAGLLVGAIFGAIIYYLNNSGYTDVLKEKCLDTNTGNSSVQSIEISKFNIDQLRNWAIIGLVSSILTVIASIIVFIVVRAGQE